MSFISDDKALAARVASQNDLNAVVVINQILQRGCSHMSARGVCVLMSVYAAGPNGVDFSAIHGMLKFNKPSITRAIDYLQRYGLVQRIIHPIDRRRLIVRISKKGRDMVNAALDTAYAKPKAA